MKRIVDRVLIAGSNADTRERILAVLHAVPGLDIVSEATEGGQAVLLTARHRPDIVVTGEHQSDCMASELIAALKARFLNTRILLIIGDGASARAGAYFAEGVHAVLPISAPHREWRTALTALRAGKRYLSSALAETGTDASRPTLESLLTQREAEVLVRICEGYSNKEIARQLKLSVRTVETHRFNIRKKTSAGPRRELVQLARRLGLAETDRRVANGG